MASTVFVVAEKIATKKERTTFHSTFFPSEKAFQIVELLLDSPLMSTKPYDDEGQNVGPRSPKEKFRFPPRKDLEAVSHVTSLDRITCPVENYEGKKSQNSVVS